MDTVGDSTVSRRRLLGAVGAATAAAAGAGCLSVSAGTMDLVVENCFEDELTAEVTVSPDGEEPVLDETVTVPGESCSEFADGVEREDVFEQPGVYTVAADVEGFDPASTRREFEAAAIEDNIDSVTVTIDEDGVSFG